MFGAGGVFAGLLTPTFFISPFHLIIFAYMFVLPVIFHPKNKGDWVHYGCCVGGDIACMFMLTLDICRVQNNTLLYAFVCYVFLSSMWEYNV